MDSEVMKLLFVIRGLNDFDYFVIDAHDEARRVLADGN